MGLNQSEYLSRPTFKRRRDLMFWRGLKREGAYPRGPELEVVGYRFGPVCPLPGQSGRRKRLFGHLD